MTDRDRTHPDNRQIDTTLQKDDIKTETHIYTDGTIKEGKSAIATVTKARGQITRWGARIEDGTDIQEAEELGLRKALLDIITHGYESTTIHTDSKTTLDKIQDINNRQRHVLEIRKTIDHIYNAGKTLRIRWTDRETLNREGTGLKDMLRTHLADDRPRYKRHVTKRDIHKKRQIQILRTWQHEWDATRGDSLTGQIIPTVGTDRINLTFKTTQLLTGHGNFRQYLRRFNIRDVASDCD